MKDWKSLESYMSRPSRPTRVPPFA